ncbi:MAG: hypothetical protein BWY22_02080 [Bacteroidetes bacterium ADurb.Bin217]|nr:MAG: hypothetical protein BWY22_02080 [Bacteroidetes bacterium ADurb.Bin217]
MVAVITCGVVSDTQCVLSGVARVTVGIGLIITDAELSEPLQPLLSVTSTLRAYEPAVVPVNVGFSIVVPLKYELPVPVHANEV